MVLSIKHKRVAELPASADPRQIQPEHWNDTHEIVGIDDGSLAFPVDIESYEFPGGGYSTTRWIARYFVLGGICHFYIDLDYSGLAGTPGEWMRVFGFPAVMEYPVAAEEVLGLSQVYIYDGDATYMELARIWLPSVSGGSPFINLPFYPAARVQIQGSFPV